MKPDIQKYQRYVDSLNLTGEQKAELIESVWRLVEGFTDRAFGDDSYSLLVAGEVKIADPDEKLIELKPRRLTEKFASAKPGETQGT